MVFKLIISILLLLIGANLVWLDYRFISDNGDIEERTDNNLTLGNTDLCGVRCVQEVNDKVATEVARLAEEWEKKLAIPSPKVVTQKTTTTVNEPKIVVIPIASSGETNSVSWTEVKPSEFYFDLTNYPGVKEVRFEAYLLADQGAAKVYARLYDSTNNRGVDYSDIQTNSSSYTRIQSSKVSIWRGNNKYIVQLKSENGTVAKMKDAKLVISY